MWYDATVNLLEIVFKQNPTWWSVQCTQWRRHNIPSPTMETRIRDFSVWWCPSVCVSVYLFCNFVDFVGARELKLYEYTVCPWLEMIRWTLSIQRYIFRSESTVVCLLSHLRLGTVASATPWLFYRTVRKSKYVWFCLDFLQFSKESAFIFTDDTTKLT